MRIASAEFSILKGLIFKKIGKLYFFILTLNYTYPEQLPVNKSTRLLITPYFSLFMHYVGLVKGTA
jgi:hypothetical protein